MNPAPYRAGLSCAALVFALAPGARAQAASSSESGRTSSLSWVRLEGAESCISTGELARGVEQRLQRKVFVSAADADVSVEGHIERAGDKWQATLTISDSDGTVLGSREVDSPSDECAQINEGLILIVSLMIDPDADSSEPPPVEPTEPEPAPVTPPAPRVIVKRERVLVPTAPQSAPSRIELEASPAVGLGLLPGTSLGVTAHAALLPPDFWGVELFGAYWFDRTVDVVQGASADVSLAYGGVGLCPLTWRHAALRGRLCPGLAAGVVRSRGRGFDTDLSDDALVAYAVLPKRVAIQLIGPVGLSAGVAVLVPLVRTELSYAAADGATLPIYEASSVALSADLGLALSFPP